jgi:hypothetical protein
MYGTFRMTRPNAPDQPIPGVARRGRRVDARSRGRPWVTTTTRRGASDITIDEAIERFLTEYLLGEKGRDPRTVRNYRGVHTKWFSPEIAVDV